MQIQIYLKNVIRHFLETITKDFVYTIDFAGLSIKRKGGIGFLRTKNFNSKEKPQFSKITDIYSSINCRYMVSLAAKDS